jgi:hypothetical protein
MPISTVTAAVKAIIAQEFLVEFGILVLNLFFQQV